MATLTRQPRAYLPTWRLWGLGFQRRVEQAIFLDDRARNPMELAVADIAATHVAHAPGCATARRDRTARAADIGARSRRVWNRERKREGLIGRLIRCSCPGPRRARRKVTLRSMTMLCTFMAGMKVFEIKLLTVAWWLAGFRPWTASVARSSDLHYDSNYPILRQCSANTSTACRARSPAAWSG